MPGPPPPPPGGMPPPPTFAPPPPMAKNAGVARDALLQSIQKGKKLKKTVTVDKSGPYIAGKSSNPSGGNSSGGSGNDRPAPSSGPPNGLVGLGALFPGGQIPKLRSVGGSNNSHTSSNGHNNSSQRSADTTLQQKNTQNEIKKRMANDNRNRGPPPPAPTRNMEDSTTPRKYQLPAPLEEQSTPRKLHLSTPRNGSANHMPSKPVSTCDLSTAGHEPNRSSLHKRTVSNSNIGSDNIDSVRNRSSFGKPNVAPKPPVLNGKMKPLNRTQSMKNPRSPSPQSPSTERNISNFGTVRNLKPELKETLAAMHQTPKQRPSLNERPKGPPPSVPQSFNPGPQLGPSKSIKHPGHAPPPPPPSMVQAQHQPPPVPPHRIAPHVPPRAAPPQPPTISSNGNTAPPPPPRVYSMKDNNSLSRQTSSQSASSPTDFESRFKFHDISHLAPLQYKGVAKVYSGKQVGSKQQAPLPPNHIQLNNNRLWDSSTC